MKKHRLLRVSIILMIIGFLVAFFSFLFGGGRPGSFQWRNGRIFYQTYDGETYTINDNVSEDSSMSTTPITPTTPVTPTTPLTDTVPSSELKKVSVEVDAAYVNIVFGDTPGLAVDGPLTYTSTFENGKWKIQNDISIESISSSGNKYWQYGNDVTTTFTIVLPLNLEEVEVHTNLGTVTIDSIVTEKLRTDISMGSLSINNTTATKSELTTNMGSINATNFTTDQCEAKADMGEINIQGSIGSSFNADASMSTIITKINRPTSYRWDADSSSATIIVDGDKKNGRGSSGNGDALSLDLTSNMGTIKVIFLR